MFCKGNDAFSCQYLNILQTQIGLDVLTVDFSAEIPFAIDILADEMSILVKDFTNENNDIQVTHDLNNCKFSKQGDNYRAVCDFAYEVKPSFSTADVAITF